MAEQKKEVLLKIRDLKIQGYTDETWIDIIKGVDLTILGGMNDGVWPEAPAPDPWRNLVMRAKARLRPQAEILDAADLIYRYNWAATDARINGRSAPAGLDGSVIYERHYALNWLIGYLDLPWDDISTDT